MAGDEVEIKPEEHVNLTAQEPSQPNIVEKAEIIKQNRENVRAIIQSLLQISGYLLTIALGVVYFGYSESGKDIIPYGTRVLVFASSLFFPISIFMNIWALRLKPEIIIEDETQVIELNKTFEKEKWWNNAAIFFLLLAVLGLIGGMIIFVVERTIGISILDQDQCKYIITSVTFLWGVVCNITELNQDQLISLKEYIKLLYTLAFNLLKFAKYMIF